MSKVIKKALTSSDIPNLLESGAQRAFQGEKQTNLAYDMCISENKSRGMSLGDAQVACLPFKNK